MVASAKHVLGYVVVGSTGLLLLAERVRVAATLPGHHEVKTVVTSRWLKIPLAAQVRGSGARGGRVLTLSAGWTEAGHVHAHAAQAPQGSSSGDAASLTPAQRDECNRAIDKITTFPVDGTQVGAVRRGMAAWRAF